MLHQSVHICQICGEQNTCHDYLVREMMFGFRDEFAYFQCPNCECLQIAQFPEDIKRYYPSHYYSFTNTPARNSTVAGRRLRLFALSALIFNHSWYHRLFQYFYSPISLCVLKDLHITVDTRILDIGCGNGLKFLYPLAELGFKRITGCDPFLQENIDYPNGLKIYKADIFSMEGNWDIITYHHVFEHIPNPLENLSKVHELLADDGVCVLRMPTVSSYAWERYREHWVQLDAPRHYFLHSLKSVRHMADRVGLKLIKVEFDSTYKQFSDSERYLRDEPLRSPRKSGFINFLRRKLQKTRYNRMAHRLNRLQNGDQAAFFLKKARDR